ncbi:hypothetical protein ASPZODRAFT_118913 [Penicilliopsis zonata CBS 506.65]|uniref:L-dopachrome isomerase n=1 Tax=Penicilliopsis zonata CBS 506.65 TaxID=1073090 RepID=A0A1L9SEV4_9EURO|nr:hypothetical protein ASPZODRAFT_118913 [Penicilliopsis zonata CBS 506.65]OJJ45750.1 hypothetical protein ASPZODRAFT_118913 [Penicilliopsis zonata CBS 506.65]
MESSCLRRLHTLSDSSTGVAADALKLYSPTTHQASLRTTAKKNKKTEKLAARPSMLLEGRDDEVVPATLAIPAPVSIQQAGPISPKVAEAEDSLCLKTQYFEDVFTARGPHDAIKDKLYQESLVVVEIKTNAKVKEDEPQLLSAILVRLAEIFQRPESSMLVTIQQNACLAYGNSPLAAYLVKVYSLPCSIAPVMNLRHTVLIQSVLEELLRIEPDRGAIIYVSIPEENLATKGETARTAITSLDQGSEEEPGVLRSISRSLSRRLRTTSTRSSRHSFATTTSRPLLAEGREPTETENKGTDEISTGEATVAIKKTKSLRKFVTRKLSELGSLGDV